MSKRDSYKQKIQGELDLILAKILEFKAHAKIAVADTRIQAHSTIQDLERKVDHTKERLADLNASSDDAWDSIKSGVETAWGDLRTSFGKAKEHFQK
ncbi:MAG: coiled coil domain-containing protein [Fibrobacterota bacterium]|nr:MAG: coiled coil domain-containing protein [Fibrobacterota bacterium]